MLAKIAELLDVTISLLLDGVSMSGSDYKLSEFSELLEKLSPVKRKMLFEFGEILLK
jgi:hypothetical protein